MAATTLITGNTFPVKEALKALGGRWNPTAKGWNVPSSRAAEALAIVGGAPSVSGEGGYRRRAASNGRGRIGRCWECGFTGRLNSDGECGRC